MKSKIVIDPKIFFSIIPFLNYAQLLDFETEYLEGGASYKRTYLLNPNNLE